MKPRAYYQPYQSGLLLAQAFSPSKTPLLRMEHLRQLDFPISREISYERTVDEFLLQLAVNDALRALRSRKDMVILLNEEGALIREDWHWSLLFTPNRSEKRTLDDSSDLYQVLCSLAQRRQDGEVCRVAVPDRSLKTLVSGSDPFCILDEFCKSQPGGYLAVAQNIVLEGTDHLFRHVPVCRYRVLSTVDLGEIENYHAIKTLLDEYIYAYDHRDAGEDAPKPISIAVFGPPGSGKSFGVKQIALSRGRFRITSLNLSQYDSVPQLFHALHQALRYEDGLIPLIFFDEFDSELGGVSRGWLKYFLAPMQDGEYTLDGSPLPIPGAVFVFAGATASSFSEFLPQAPEDVHRFQAIKGPDFVSRLKGILDIKGPNPTCVTDKKHIIRRAMLLRSLILKNVKGICHPDTGRVDISRGLLCALLRVSEYRHGARSIEFILGMSRLAGASRYTPSCLPLAAQLDIHVDVQDFMRKLTYEQMMGEAVEQYAFTAHEKYRQKHLADAQARGATPKELSLVRQEPEMADWSDLDEFYKEGHRSQIRYLGERLESFNMSIGLRPVLPGAADTIMDLYGPVLEQLSELEHERWMKDKRADGWRYGKRDSELKLHPDMRPYQELDESTKEFIRMSVRNVPDYLKEIGYELYRKSF